MLLVNVLSHALRRQVLQMTQSMNFIVCLYRNHIIQVLYICLDPYGTIQKLGYPGSAPSAQHSVVKGERMVCSALSSRPVAIRCGIYSFTAEEVLPESKWSASQRNISARTKSVYPLSQIQRKTCLSWSSLDPVGPGWTGKIQILYPQFSNQTFKRRGTESRRIKCGY